MIEIILIILVVLLLLGAIGRFRPRGPIGGADWFGLLLFVLIIIVLVRAIT